MGDTETFDREHSTNENACKICFDDKEEVDFIYCVSCRNKLCNTCYDSYITGNNRNFRSSLCPYCRVLWSNPEPFFNDSVTITIESRTPYYNYTGSYSTMYAIYAVERLLSCLCAGFSAILISVYFYFWITNI